MSDPTPTPTAISLKVELPAHSHAFQVQVDPTSTVRDVKRAIAEACEGGPRVEGQRIVWRGRLLGDEERVVDVWKAPEESRVVHLAVHPSAWSSSPPPSLNSAPAPTTSTTSTPNTSGNPVTSTLQSTAQALAALQNQNLLPLPPLPTQPQPQPQPQPETQPQPQPTPPRPTPRFPPFPPLPTRRPSSASQPPPQTTPHSYPYSYPATDPQLTYVLNKHQSALLALTQNRVAATRTDEAATRRVAVGALERVGWSWPAVLDEEWPPAGGEDEGVKYESIAIQNHRFLSLTTPTATPTPLQLHALKVLSYTFPILLNTFYPPPITSYVPPYPYWPTHPAPAPANLNLNAHLQHLGLPALHANANPHQHNPIRDIPIRALLAPLIMLALRTLLLMYFVSPTRKPVIGIVLGAWVVYEAWGVVRAALGAEQEAREAVRAAAQAAAARAQGGAGGGVDQGQGRRGANGVAGARGAGAGAVRGNNPLPANPARTPRAPTPGDRLIDTLARLNLSSESRALDGAQQPPPAEPGWGHKLRTFVALMVVTVHPEVWNRRRGEVRRREGRVRGEVAVLGEGSAAAGEGEGEGEGEREARERAAARRAEVGALHQRRAGWVRAYVERVRVGEWADD